MFKQSIIAVVLVLFSWSAHADTDSHRALAEEVLEITKANTILDNMTAHMRNMYAQAVQSMNVPAEKKPLVEEYGNKLADLLKQEMNWEELKGQFIDVYVTTFTEQELKELVDFYQSPLGQKMITKMPQLMQQSMQIGQQQMREVMPKIQALAQEMATKMKQTPPAQ